MTVKDLAKKIPSRGRTLMYLVYVAAIVGTPDYRSQDAKSYINRVQVRLREFTKYDAKDAD